MKEIKHSWINLHHERRGFMSTAKSGKDCCLHCPGFALDEQPGAVGLFRNFDHLCDYCGSIDKIIPDDAGPAKWIGRGSFTEISHRPPLYLRHLNLASPDSPAPSDPAATRLTLLKEN